MSAEDQNEVVHGSVFASSLGPAAAEDPLFNRDRNSDFGFDVQ